MTDIYRTVFQVEVFSEGPLNLETDVLEGIAYEINEGDCIGMVTEISREIVPPDKLQDELVRIGNDGSFFTPDECDECGNLITGPTSHGAGCSLHPANEVTP